MSLIKKWETYMGPKDERLVAESNRIMRIGYTILLAGTALALYYGLMLTQVASTTDTPIFTALGERVFPLDKVLLIVFVLGTFIPCGMFMRSGITTERNRYAQVDYVPWNYVVQMSLLCALIIGVLSAGMRIVAEIQIVGLGQVAWIGDIAMGFVFAGMGFAIGMVAISASFKAAIENRKKLDEELDDGLL